MPRTSSNPETAGRRCLAEVAGALADLGVFLPIAVVLIVANGLSATSVLLAAGLMYLLVGGVYRLPIPVQPMKALTAFAVAHGLTTDVIAAAGLLIGVLMAILGGCGLLAHLQRMIPLPIVRGVQLAVGLALLKVAVDLIIAPPPVFGRQIEPAVAAVLAVLLLAGLRLRPQPVLLLALAAGTTAMLLGMPPDGELGPSGIVLPDIGPADLATALTVLVLPQLPLTVASSCVATADATRRYYGESAARVTPSMLGMTVGGSNLLAGLFGAMPMCHGSGGVTAHYRFGARTGLAPVLLGATMIALGIGFGGHIAATLGGFPLWILAAMLGSAAVLHIALLADLRNGRDLALAVSVGVASLVMNLALVLVIAMVGWWLCGSLSRRGHYRQRTEVRR